MCNALPCIVQDKYIHGSQLTAHIVIFVKKICSVDGEVCNFPTLPKLDTPSLVPSPFPSGSLSLLVSSGIRSPITPSRDTGVFLFPILACTHLNYFMGIFYNHEKWEQNWDFSTHFLQIIAFYERGWILLQVLLFTVESSHFFSRVIGDVLLLYTCAMKNVLRSWKDSIQYAHKKRVKLTQQPSPVLTSTRVQLNYALPRHDAKTMTSASTRILFIPPCVFLFIFTPP